MLNKDQTIEGMIQLPEEGVVEFSFVRKGGEVSITTDSDLPEHLRVRLEKALKESFKDFRC